MNWYKHWFNHPLYLELYSHRDEQEARKVVELVLSATGLARGSHLLDLGSGPGRHSIAFTKRGIDVVAADLSPLLLRLAAKTAFEEGVTFPLVQADMRRIPFSRTFDAVAQLFTAFGYFEDDAENTNVVAEVARIVRPGGWYFLDFLNAPFVSNTLVPRTETRSGPRNVIQERAIQDGRVEKTIIVMHEGKEEARFEESVRMYTVDELTQMFETNGFHVVQCFGDYHGMPLTDNSPRCILLGKRIEDA